MTGWYGVLWTGSQGVRGSNPLSSSRNPCSAGLCLFLEVARAFGFTTTTASTTIISRFTYPPSLGLPLFIGGAAVTAVWLVQLILSAADWNPPWFLSAPSILGTFGVFFYAFDRWLWRKRLFRLIGWTAVPDLKGSWVGTAQETSTADRDAVDVTVEIEQNWSSISIVLTGNDSRSVSTVAGFETKEAGPTRLVY